MLRFIDLDTPLLLAEDPVLGGYNGMRLLNQCGLQDGKTELSTFSSHFFVCSGRATLQVGQQTRSWGKCPLATRLKPVDERFFGAAERFRIISVLRQQNLSVAGIRYWLIASYIVLSTMLEGVPM